MTVTIHDVRAHVHANEPAARSKGLVIHGATTTALENVQVYYEIPSNGVQSANLRAVSDVTGYWQITFPGDFAAGTEVTVYARGVHTPLAWYTQTL